MPEAGQSLTLWGNEHPPEVRIQESTEDMLDLKGHVY